MYKTPLIYALYCLVNKCATQYQSHSVTLQILFHIHLSSEMAFLFLVTMYIIEHLDQERGTFEFHLPSDWGSCSFCTFVPVVRIRTSGQVKAQHSVRCFIRGRFLYDYMRPTLAPIQQSLHASSALGGGIDFHFKSTTAQRQRNETQLLNANYFI